MEQRRAYVVRVTETESRGVGQTEAAWYDARVASVHFDW
jgi:hypothetical protein